MGMDLTVFVEPGTENTAVSNMFRDEGYDVTQDIHRADFICLIGGSDVDPTLYKEENTSSYTDLRHDLISIGLSYYSDILRIPIIGICRGGQFLSSFAGELTLVQHIEGHQATNHTITIPAYSEYGEYDGIEVTSDHHQCMSRELMSLGSNEDKEVFLSSGDNPVVEVLIDRTPVKDKESFMLCYQPHPEWVDKYHPCRRLFFAIIENEFRKLKENL